MAQTYPTLPQCAIVATAIKVLLFPAYKSTDFEVHRNWLAITHSLPLPKWYFEKTSEWTLDYPPFFAYFEYALSWIARYVEPAMLQIKAAGYDSWRTIAFQRSTVIVSELVLFLALVLFIESALSSERKRAQTVALSILLSPGLLIIDHIHFQYNGFLYGILVMSLALMRFENGKLASGILFAVLLCFKHIYLYLAPAYFVYLLRAYCLSPKSIFRPQLGNAIKLGLGIGLVFAAAFGPFWYLAQLDQVVKRLFPFSRGLCHAYWAPNVWALYSFLDRTLIQVLPRIPQLKYTIKQTALNSVTRGLVGDTSFAVLPEITPQMTFLLTLGFQIIPLIKLFLTPTWDTFIGAITLCGYASFLFGWHVHEKAILLVIIPFSLIALKDRRYLGAFRPLVVAGHLSLFPLIFTPGEWLVKVVYTLAWLVVFLFTFDKLAPAASRQRVFILDRLALAYTVFIIPVIIYCSLIHPLLAARTASAKQYEFLPLMFTSAYCALGVVGSWLGFMVVYFTT